MGPLGRRRSPSSHWTIPLLILVILSATASAASAVLGIDLGTEYIKAALVKPGIPLEIVLTKDSKRKEAATIAFKPSRLQQNDANALPERLYGGDASALAGRFPADVYPNLKAVLGVNAGSDEAREYVGRYPGLNMEPVVRNETAKQSTVAFKSQVFDNKEPPFMVEEILAMELKNIKANAEAAAGKGTVITDVVLTVPAFYTAEEKRALEFAADLAGLKVLGIVSDGLAVGLNYATSRTFPSVTDGAKPEFHLVYDMGAGSTTATVLRCQGRTIKDGKRNKTIQEVQVMSTSWKKGLGGDAWNELIMDDMIAKFVDTSKMKTLEVLPIHVKKNGKTMARLWKEAERMRQVLSANSHTSATLEGLFFEDVNFKYKLSRAEFEELAVVQASQVGVPLVHALDAAGISTQTLDSVILHGGAVRTPFVQKHLEATVGGSSKIRTNVNADEAAVLGAAFKAAGLSPSFRVKDIRADDISGFDVRLRWTPDGKELVQKVFTRTSFIGAEKQVPLRLLQDSTFELSQTVDEKEVAITEIKALNLTASVAQLVDKHGCAPANITTKFTMRLSPLNGLPEIISGSVSCEAETAKEGSVMENVRGLFGFGSKKSDGQEPLKDEEASENDMTSTSTSASSSTTTSASSMSSSSSSSSSSTTEKATKPSSSTVTIRLSIKARPLGVNLPLSPDQQTRIKTRLAQLDSSDLARVLRAEALNTLESFTYRAREYLTDAGFIDYSPENVRKTLDQKLSETSEWLYGDGVDASLEDFRAKLKELKGLIEPVLNRQAEAEKREEGLKELREGLEQMKGMMTMVQGSIEKAEEDEKIAKAEAATSSSSSSSSSVSAAEASSAASSTADSVDADEHDDLDDDPYSSPSSSSPSSPTDPSPDSQPTVIAPYSLTDLSTLQSSYDSISTWLERKSHQQDQLGPHDDPAVLVRELEAKTRELQAVIREVVVKNIRIPAGFKGGNQWGGKGGKEGKGGKGEGSGKGQGQGSGKGGGKDEGKGKGKGKGGGEGKKKNAKANGKESSSSAAAAAAGDEPVKSPSPSPSPSPAAGDRRDKDEL